MTTVSIQPDGTAGVDSFIESGSPTTNNGTSGVLQSGESSTATSTFRALLKFDLSGIPPTATINSASLVVRLALAGTGRASNNRTHRLYRLKRAWVEGQVTWNIYSTGNSWSTAGGFHLNDCEQTDCGTCSFATADALDAFKTFTLNAALIQGMVDGTFTNNGFLWKADTENNDAYRSYSSDDATAANRPELIIDYTAAGGGQTITPNFISSTETVYSPTITTGAVTVAPSFISSGATVYSPTVSQGSVTVSPDFIVSTATVYSPTVTTGAVSVSPDFIASVATVYSPTVTQGDPPGQLDTPLLLLLATAIEASEPTQTITPSFIDSAAQVFSPTVTPGAVTLAPAFIDSVAQVFSPTVLPGPITVLVAFIASGAVVYNPTVSDGSAAIPKLDVSLADYARYAVVLADEPLYAVALSDSTR